MRLWKRYPPHLIRQSIIVPGGAFQAKYEFRQEGEKVRYFFILNQSPRDDAELVVVTATTQVERRRRHRPQEVLVSITPADYEPLSKRSVVDCESAQTWPQSQLIERIAQREIRPLEPLPDEIMQKIHKAVAVAKTLSPHVKRLVLGEDL